MKEAHADEWKEEYGDKWEEVLYATAWKKFNKTENTEETEDTITEQIAIGSGEPTIGEPHILGVHSDFTGEVYGKQNSFFRNFTNGKLNHFTRGRVYWAKKEAGSKDVLVSTSKIPLPVFVDNFSFAPVWVDDDNFTAE